MKGPKTKTELWRFIGRRFNLWLPYRSLSPGHSNPFEFIWDACCHPGQKLAAWANRSGMKTLCALIIAALEFLHSDKPIKARVLSGSGDQARNLYGYWQRWCWSVLRGRLVGEPGRQLTRLDNGDFEILAASQKRVRGAKVQRLFRDEEDEIDPEISAASVGMLAGLEGVPARTVVTSTWHNPGGPMGQLVAGAEAKGFHLHKWNIWESLTNCPPQRHDHGRNCRCCLLGEVCLAKAREQSPAASVGIAAQCSGLLAIDDAIGQLREWSLQQWQAEAECKRPALEGLVYPQFDRRVHVMDRLDFRDGPRTYRAIDFGLNNFVCLWAQIDKAGTVYVVDEYWSQHATTYQNAREIAGRDQLRQIEATFCDPAGRSRSDQTGFSDIEVLAGCGIGCRYRLDRWATTVQNGVGLIRAALKPAVGQPRLFVAGRCKHLIAAFEGYRLRKVNNQYIDEPRKPQEPWEHPLDALRYLMLNAAAPAQAEARYMGYS